MFHLRVGIIASLFLAVSPLHVKVYEGVEYKDGIETVREEAAA
ncbi:MAG: hypothetical protein Q8P59_06220 [Dehalococcoidia bacterium]|nr:hypothetical protein [Dehalococcoidia bacterium]